MSDKFLGFRFNTNNGFDHLACAVAANAVSDTLRTVNPLPAGATVVVLAKKGERYMVVSGTATGKVLEVSPQEVWEEWNGSNTLVHEVVFKTRPVFVPKELASRPGQRQLGAEHAEELAYFAFANG
jgi:hypothetical protein